MLETDAVKMLRSFLLEITDDEVVVRDTVEGETNIRHAIHGVLKDMLEDEITMAGLQAVIKTLSERLDRISLRHDRRRTAIQKALVLAEVHRLDYPECHVSLRKVAPGLFIEDENKIPPQFFDPQPSKLSKSRLKDALKEGKSIEGCRLDNGSITIAVKRS
jgi:hypothetical protein